MDTQRFPKIIEEIYTKVEELERMFPGRHFTPDGHMLGSIGEAIAQYYYGVKLYSAGRAMVDGSVNGREVQIKATQRDRVALKKHSDGDLLLILKINQNGDFEEIYNGDAKRAWDSLTERKESFLREKTISLNKLRELQAAVSPDDRIKRLK